MGAYQRRIDQNLSNSIPHLSLPHKRHRARICLLKDILGGDASWIFIDFPFPDSWQVQYPTRSLKVIASQSTFCPGLGMPS